MEHQQPQIGLILIRMWFHSTRSTANSPFHCVHTTASSNRFKHALLVWTHSVIYGEIANAYHKHHQVRVSENAATPVTRTARNNRASDYFQLVFERDLGPGKESLQADEVEGQSFRIQIMFNVVEGA